MASKVREHLWVFWGAVAVAIIYVVGNLAVAWINKNKAEPPQASSAPVAAAPPAKPAEVAADPQAQNADAVPVRKPIALKTRGGRQSGIRTAASSSQPQATDPPSVTNITKQACSNVNTTINAPTINNCSGVSQ